VTYLLDTNVVAELRRRTPDPGVLAWLDGVADDDLHVSVLVLGEIRRGVEMLRRRDAARADAIAAWLTTMEDRFADRVVPVSAAVADRWGCIDAPDPLPVVDGLMAATALVHGWTFVTRNGRDVARTGVATLDPFLGGGRKGGGRKGGGGHGSGRGGGRG
jgi:hypothetical protein